MKKRMKKLSALCLAGMLCLGLWACSSSEDSSSGDSSGPTKSADTSEEGNKTGKERVIAVRESRKPVKTDFL